MDYVGLGDVAYLFRATKYWRAELEKMVLKVGDQVAEPMLVHAGVKNIQCRYCHPYLERSIHPGLPPVEKCLHCHKYIIANHPWIKKEHEYFNTNTPTPWVKVNYVAEHVLFNHQRHINSKIACQECHGQVQEIQRLPQKIWRMGECVECHQKKNANLDCWLACHS